LTSRTRVYRLNPVNMIRLGVSGLTGMIGKNLIIQHAAAGASEKIELIAFTRKESATEFLQRHEIERREIDYTDPESFSGKLEDIDAFLHLAGLTKAVTPKSYYRVNVENTAVLLDALSRYGKKVKHFLFSSSTSAPGPAPSSDEPKTEEDPCSPVSHYGRSKLKAENLIRSSRQNWTILRFPAVWGPFDFEGLNLFQMAKNGFITLFCSAQVSYSYIAAQDVGRFLLRFILDERLYGEIYQLCYDESLTGHEFAITIRQELGLPPKYTWIHVPRWLSYPIRAFLAVKLRIQNQASIVNPDKIAEMSTLYWLVSNKKIKDALGITTIEEEGAISETIQWFRERQLL